MKYYTLLTLLLSSGILFIQSCDKKQDSDLQCKSITLNKSFTARIGEEWCIPSTDWKITLGPVIEDGRCNVTGTDCVWAGQFVMGASIYNGEAIQDTFEAVYNWSDTLYSGPYSIILNKVYPETRSSFDILDNTKYSFDMLIK